MAKIKNNYSLIIIGAGPAGLTASIYASRFKINNLIIGQAVGGMAFEAHEIGNFPGYEKISGMELINKIQKHAESLGATTVIDKVNNISRENNQFKVVTENNNEFWAETILLATGTKHNKLNLPNEDKYIGRGVSYCATCDAMFYKDKIVAVIGGSDSANTAALYLAKVAKKVYQIYRRQKLRGDSLWIDQVMNNKKVEVVFETEVKKLEGNNKLEKIILNVPYKNKKELEIDGLFVEIGNVPQKALIKDLNLDLSEEGYIVVDTNQSTNQAGIWAAGDITNASNDFHQIITACSEGAIAAENIFNFLQKNKIK